MPDSPLNSENDPLRGQKATLYEGGTRVCAFAHWPGTLKPYKFTTPMHCVDWLPTIASLVGYEIKPELKLDGVSQWAALQDEGAESTPRTIYIAKPGQRSLRQGDWKLISGDKGKAELYNIAADPYEKTNLAKSEPQKVAALQQLLSAEHAKDNPVLPKDLKGLPN